MKAALKKGCSVLAKAICILISNLSGRPNACLRPETYKDASTLSGQTPGFFAPIGIETMIQPQCNVYNIIYNLSGMSNFVFGEENCELKLAVFIS